jgi:hypothetical protein
MCQLEHKLSELLGQRASRNSGLGAPADTARALMTRLPGKLAPNPLPGKRPLRASESETLESSRCLT